MNLQTLTAYTSAAFLTLLAVAGPVGSVAAAGRGEPASTSTAAAKEARAARPTATSDLSEWVGVYPFSEFFKPNFFYDYHIVILDAKGASQIFGKGHTTCVRLNGIAKAEGKNKVNIYYESDAVGCPAGEGFSKGDLLLSIERASRGYLVRWKALSPDSAPTATVYREDEGIDKDGRRLEGPFWGEGFFNRVSPGGACAYDLQYLVFYNINPPIAAQIDTAVRAAAGVPAPGEMKECDKAQSVALTPPNRSEPPVETGPRYCKEAEEFVIGFPIGVHGYPTATIQVQLSDGPCDPDSDQERTFSQQRLTLDLRTGRFSQLERSLPPRDP